MTRTRALLLPCLALAALTGCGGESDPRAHAEHVDSLAFERGPHGGRWLADGDFALELTILEAGIPPELRAFVYRDAKPAPASGVELEATLRRLGGRIDRIDFEPRGEYLAGDRVVAEPHSFDVELVARESGREHRFRFASYENRVVLAPEQVAAAGIRVARAGPAQIRERLALHGRIAIAGDALARVLPRFPGVVRSVHRRLGDAVARDELLARIESNESLRSYELRAPLAGTVIARDVAPGEFVSGERELFRIADLGTVWVELDVHARDLGALRVGQRVRVDAGDGSAPAEARLDFISPIGAPGTQTSLARALLPNPDGAWRPGRFVTVEVEIAESAAAVAVEREALQRIGDHEAVFVVEGDVFEAQPVELGRGDAARVEVVSGLAAGQPYVAAGSFVLKAEAGKSGAAHDH